MDASTGKGVTAHQWVRLDQQSATGLQYWGRRVRRCSRCGVEQEQEETSWYGRIIERRWRPLVGRCKGESK